MSAFGGEADINRDCRTIVIHCAVRIERDLGILCNEYRPQRGQFASRGSPCLHRCHEMAVIRSRIWSLSAGHYRQPGTDHEKIDECAALRCAKKGRQDPGQARARQVGHSGGARARSRNGAAVCGPAFNEAPSYRAAEAPIGREVQREVLTGRRRSLLCY